jgi:hypothetical protein
MADKLLTDISLVSAQNVTHKSRFPSTPSPWIYQPRNNPPLIVTSPRRVNRTQIGALAAEAIPDWGAFS